MATLKVLPAARLAGALGKLTCPVLALYTPAPSAPPLMTTPTRPGLSCRVTVGLTAALAPTLAKLAVPLTVVPTGALAGVSKLTLISDAIGVMGAANTQPNGVPVAVHVAGSTGVAPAGFTAALLTLDTSPANACGVTLIVNAAVAPAAMPLAVVIEHTRSSPADTAPDERQVAAVVAVPKAALLNAKLGGNLSFTTMTSGDVAAPAALLMVST